jgi:CRISPR/Cas system CSM-associated protein Csm3 (group 7 of RAMP superfamily)
MIAVRFSVQFHQPFLVRSGMSGPGVDAIARVDTPLPASSLKGAMRAAAQALNVDSRLAESVFGRATSTLGASRRGAWAWTDAGPSSAFEVQLRARNRIDAASGVARAEALTVSEEYWQSGDSAASFAVEQICHVESDDLDRHMLVLHAAAHAVTALGSWRNRGMGTVTIRPLTPLDRFEQRWQEVAS